MAFKDTRIWLGLDRPVWAGLLLLLLMLAGLYVWLDWDEPRPVTVQVENSGYSASQWEIMLEVDRIEGAHRPAGDDPPPPGWEQALARALSLQENLLRSARTPDPVQTLRMERLLTLRDTLQARALWPRLQAAETDLAATTDSGLRITLLEELLMLRRQINRSHAEPRYKDLVLETRLARELEELQAGPVHAAATAAHAAARTAAENRDWVQALALYTRAREHLETIIRLHPRTKYADLALLTRVRTEEEALQGAGPSLEAALFAQGAEVAAAAGQSEEAAERYARAIALQQQLNERWPRSRFASTLRLEEWEVGRQSVLAEAALAEIRRHDAQITGLLARRQTLLAGEGIAAVEATLDKLGRDYPKRKAGDLGLRRKYAFLALTSGMLRALQDEIYENLLALPGMPERLMLRSEVKQSLYQRIMKFNPSREPGPDKPVDSVAWDDALEFCRRLTWLLGHPVRLPQAHEYALARGDVLGERSGAQPVAFQNMTDAVAEWLMAPETGARAPLASAGADPDDTTGTTDLPKTTRRRDLGFRIVVELPAPQAPAGL